MERWREPGFGRKPNLVFSVFLIAAGILLFLANLNLLPISVHQVWQLWPLIFVALGAGKLIRTRRPSALVIGGMLIVFGLIFTLVDLEIIHIHLHDDSWPLSLLFLALGIGGLAKVLESGNPRWRQPGSAEPFAIDPTNQPSPPWPTKENWAGWSQSSNSVDTPVLDNLALMASIKRKVESVNFQGGTLTAFWGSIDVDLRRSRPPDGRNTIMLDATVIMGSIKVRVPETWRVAWNGINIMANFEDKTIPGISGTAAPVLIVTGYLFMGSIEVES